MKQIIFILFLLPATVFSQELMCRVSVNYSQVNTTNTQVFTAMQRDISEFMNTTRWTDYIFSNQERIECSILINISQYDGVDNFKGTIQVSASRPAYDASLTTQEFNIKEKSNTFDFKYIENQPIEFNKNTYTSELAYTLAFYAYLIIGMDFDTFSELGGTPFFEEMQKIVANAQSSPSQAWKTLGTNREDNRYYIAKNLNSPVYRDFRLAMYKYHRLGLDNMTSDITNGRQNITEALELIKKVYQKKPNNFIVNMFVETKRQEIKYIYSEAPPQEVNRAKQIMQFIDPVHSSDYDQMGQQH